MFDTLYPIICVFARKITADFNDAEDASQEAFVELWHQHAKFETMNHIKSFLYLSVKNKCLNIKKHQAVKANYSGLSQENIEPSFEENIIEAEVIYNLNKAINGLPEQQKQVILHSIQGFTNEEIANSMGISVNTVKLYKKKAYQHLREKLGSSLFILYLL